MKISSLFMIPILLQVVSCAGPITPFGAVDFVHVEKETKELDIHPGRFLASENTMIYIDSPYLLFHRPYEINIQMLKEKELTPTLNLNGNTIDLLKLSNVEKYENDKIVNYKIKNIKLNPELIYSLKINLKDKYQNIIYSTKLGYPECPIGLSFQVKNYADFDVNKKIKDIFTDHSDEFQVNPTLLASLVAQESSFNPNAVSSAKAIGLTQITPLAAHEISKMNPHWPINKKVNKLNYMQIRYQVESGILNETNDWRLNTKKSLIGGSRYMTKIDEYWNKEKNSELLNQYNYKYPREAVILASYNSGPSRVKRQMKDYHEDWINSPKLNEARKYVQNILGYCHDFTNEDL